MKMRITLFSICCVLVAGFLTACDWKPDSRKVVLGPMLSEAYLPDPLGRQTVGDMRKWVQNFKPSDAKKLNDTGKIVFSWEELQASYPEQARIADDYVEQRRTGFVEAYKNQSKPIPNRLATHHIPDTVEVKKSDRGECWVVISSKEGIAHADLEISTAR